MMGVHSPVHSKSKMLLRPLMCTQFCRVRCFDVVITAWVNYPFLMLREIMATLHVPIHRVHLHRDFCANPQICFASHVTSTLRPRLLMMTSCMHDMPVTRQVAEVRLM